MSKSKADFQDIVHERQAPYTFIKIVADILRTDGLIDERALVRRLRARLRPRLRADRPREKSALEQLANTFETAIDNPQSTQDNS